MSKFESSPTELCPCFELTNAVVDRHLMKDAWSHNATRLGRIIFAIICGAALFGKHWNIFKVRLAILTAGADKTSWD